MKEFIYLNCVEMSNKNMGDDLCSLISQLKQEMKET